MIRVMPFRWPYGISDYNKPRILAVIRKKEKKKE